MSNKHIDPIKLSNLKRVIAQPLAATKTPSPLAGEGWGEGAIQGQPFQVPRINSITRVILFTAFVLSIGIFIFSASPTGAWAAIPNGDINGDGAVNAGDVVLAQRIAMGIVTATPDQLSRGDVAPIDAPDGVINAADVVVIQRIAMGLIKTYSVTASADANGTISPSGAVSVISGATTTFTITPNTGYRVLDVLVDGVSKGAITSYTFNNVTASHTITASFAIDNYTITASADANGTISPSGAVSVISGATTTFTVTPNTGYRVSDVLVDGASVGALSAYTFTNVTANHTISASFEANAPVALTLSGVGITSNTLNTAMEEAATIFFTLNSNATVTLKIIPEKLGPAGTPVYQASQVCPTAGAYMFTWAGKDSTGKVVPDEAYLYILLASDGTNTDTYSPPAPTGTGSITCTQATDYNPYKNVPLTVSYHVPQDARVNISIGSRGILPFKIMNAVPHTIGDYALDWDGRDPSGNFLAYRGDSACSVDSLLRVNYIITSGDTPKITLVKTDPYQMALSYGQFSRIQYNLSRDANVTVTLRSPAGVTVTLISSQYQSAGSHDYTPVNLLDGTDATGKKFVISEEGDYAVSIQAVNPVTGSNSIVKGNIRIGY